MNVMSYIYYSGYRGQIKTIYNLQNQKMYKKPKRKPFILYLTFKMKKQTEKNYMKLGETKTFLFS